jgi:hypothetical protein
MMPNVKIKLLVENRLVGGHVFNRGDVVEVSEDRAKEFQKAKAGIRTEEAATPIPKPRPRSELIAENAANAARKNAEKAVRHPVRA